MYKKSNRDWLVIQFYKENNLSLFTQLPMLAIPQYGDYIQFSKNVAEGIFQVITSPKHNLGRSLANRDYHYISVQIREVIEPIEKELENAL